MDDAHFDKPKNPKNCICGAPIYYYSNSEEENGEGIGETHHVIESWWGQLGDHRMRESVM